MPSSTKNRCTQRIEGKPEQKRGWFGGRKSEEELLMERVEQHELEELQTFIAQKLFRVDGILCDEQTRIMLVEKLMNAKEYPTISHDELVHRYGSPMAGWLRDRLVPSMTDCSSVLQRAAAEFYKDKMSDPLCNWGQLNPEHVTMIAARIAKFSEEMSSKVKWSLLVEPGKFSCHLTEFVQEFNRLERMFMNNELSDEEAAQTAFNANYLTKARSKMVPCAEYSRVKLNDGLGHLDDRNEMRSGMFSDEHEFLEDEGCTTKSTYGTTDFIHANYIKGGPLLNTFICAQAPLKNTQEDFWRMVFQEKCKFIVMLNSAVDSSTLGPLDSANRNHCPYYWPRSEKQFLQFGPFRITCVSVDSKADPLFTITKLKLQKVGGNLADDECDEELLLEHWQWDWQYLGDVHWPFRVLRKARQLSTPTIVQCIDGCSKAGTLVAIETTLMSFIRGAPITKSLILQSCVFVRLQRRLSVSSALLYLFIYRVVLRWIEPYVCKWYERAALGLRFKSIGFIQKYTEDSIRTTGNPLLDSWNRVDFLSKSSNLWVCSSIQKIMLLHGESILNDDKISESETISNEESRLALLQNSIDDLEECISSRHCHFRRDLCNLFSWFSSALSNPKLAECIHIILPLINNGICPGLLFWSLSGVSELVGEITSDGDRLRDVKSIDGKNWDLSEWSF